MIPLNIMMNYAKEEMAIPHKIFNQLLQEGKEELNETYLLDAHHDAVNGGFIGRIERIIRLLMPKRWC
jgi:hypothetical protein